MTDKEGNVLGGPFANETEEADWWYDNREAHEERWAKAFREGKVRVITMEERMRRLAASSKEGDAASDRVEATHRDDAATN